MDRPLRILVVDDSALMRQMISRFLVEAGMEVVGTARDGQDGLEKALALKPDVITLDVEMPKMNGLEMLKALGTKAYIPVVMLSSLTHTQTATALEALTLGAVDVVGKPGGRISLNLQEVRDELIQKVKVAATVRIRRGQKVVQPVSSMGQAAFSEGIKARRQMNGIVVIGSSTGGPGVLSEVIPCLPADFPLPIAIVQHMPSGFTLSLARRLDDLSQLTVREAQDGCSVYEANVWVAPGGRHLVFHRDGTVRLTNDPPHLGVRPAVDYTLESAASVWGRGVIAVILTGMGMDGARGARKVKQAGGRVIAQDEETSVVYGMPRAVVEMGLADFVCGQEDIPQTIVRTVQEIGR